MADPTKPFGDDLVRGAVTGIDDRMYDGIGEDFDPMFVKPRAPEKKRTAPRKPDENPALIRKLYKNKAFRKEERSLESLKREWASTLAPEHEKVLPLVADVITVPKATKLSFVQDLKLNMDSIEAFFIKEIAPVEVAFGDAVERARQTISLITDSDVDQDSIVMLQNMFREAIRLKTFDFMCNKLGMPDNLRKVLIDKYFAVEADNDRSPRKK